jgi:hypothetical protein
LNNQIIVGAGLCDIWAINRSHNSQNPPSINTDAIIGGRVLNQWYPVLARIVPKPAPTIIVYHRDRGWVLIPVVSWTAPIIPKPAPTIIVYHPVRGRVLNQWYPVSARIVVKPAPTIIVIEDGL